MSVPKTFAGLALGAEPTGVPTGSTVHLTVVRR